MPEAFPITVPILGGNPLAPLPSKRPGWETIPSPTGRFDVHADSQNFTAVWEALRRADTPGSIWWHELHLAAEALADSVPSKVQTGARRERFLVLDHCADVWRQAGVVLYPHQLHVLRRVLCEMNGRAILADEVGLGKTIEAGMILKEYLLRQLVRKVLILVPASLIWQWYIELKDKFGVFAAIQRTEWDWERCDLLIASLDTAKRQPHRDAVLSQCYDLLIVDEAHRLKNRRTLNWNFVNRIRRHYCLLLTATPVQNSLDELYSLVTLLKPGHLGSSRLFQRLFTLDARRARDPKQLRELLSRVMIRHRRGPDTIDLPPRYVHPIPVELSPAERHFYDALTAYIRGVARKAGGDGVRGARHLLPLITLQREAVSSAPAAIITLQKMIARTSDRVKRASLQHLLHLAAAVQGSAKADALLQLIAQSDEQFLVFTEYRATQAYLLWRLEQAGISHVGFDGSLSLGRREFAREWFRRHARVMVSTESGGEGINFQFCRNVVNYDLPWNPQRVEQRIGRVHRLGQTRPVHIYNLATRDTIEAYILYLLDEKLDLFRQVVGISSTPWPRGSSFEAAIARIVLTTETSEQAYEQLDRFGDAVNQRMRRAGDTVVDRILGGGL